MSQNENIKKIELYLSSRFQLPPEQVAEMIPTFITTLKEHVVNLENALKSGSLVELGGSGHTIKGALLNLGLFESAEIALEIEKNGKAEDQGTDYQALVGKIKADLTPLFK
ncbi:Hpt domain-containing protein [Desulfopila sp. IMCC35008]|uniref:Hpt domain-containing protein n=1 Tax=Desulfopila sp. IMCC35008 TaxID=2653858 RepID=UPI0013D87B90|nr:Hpt domain-containing protein [Desulfopila sp. IMCC35008]